jgi:Na+-translocating ferredoxin:NAD+ oxidoreductase RNF subunit RnfB
MMNDTDAVYVELRKHLDKQAVGFPETKSGVEIRILKELFTPEQASLALHLSFEPQTAADIHKSAANDCMSAEKATSLLDGMVENGSIGIVERGGVHYYHFMPLLIGIAEWHGSRSTPQFWADFNDYLIQGYGKAYATTKVSQMRTIPVQKSIPVEHRVTTYDHVREIINTTQGRIGIAPCMCREGAKRRGEVCKVTSRVETCMCFGDWANHFIKLGAREITREEALEIIRQNEADGLVLQPNNYQKLDFICSCCGCCCGVLKIQKILPNPAVQWAHNFYAAVTADLCTGCGICVEKCQVNAVLIEEQTGCAAINLDRCIGCGNCVANCPSDAMQLVKVEAEAAPPEEKFDLYRILAEKG